MTATLEPLLFERALDPSPLLPEDRADELRLRDDAADEPRLEALARLGLLLEDPLRLLLLEDPLRLLLLEAF